MHVDEALAMSDVEFAAAVERERQAQELAGYAQDYGVHPPYTRFFKRQPLVLGDVHDKIKVSHEQVRELVRALEAGNYNSAPTKMEQGSNHDEEFMAMFAAPAVVAIAVGQVWSSAGVEYEVVGHVGGDLWTVEWTESGAKRRCDWSEQGMHQYGKLVRLGPPEAPKPAAPPKPDLSRFPHKCPRCQAPAYVGFDSTECSASCR